MNFICDPDDTILVEITYVKKGESQGGTILRCKSIEFIPETRELRTVTGEVYYSRTSKTTIILYHHESILGGEK